MDFKEACLNKLTDFERLDDWVEYWHSHDTHNTLCEFLGLTDMEYGIWLRESDEALKAVLDAYRCI